ncbi:MAG: hypothetical protein J6I64_07990 [Lachnospiraceae bacterium]|nr:hypothetical protein [Lachnospiraceae bacterium]
MSKTSMKIRERWRLLCLVLSGLMLSMVWIGRMDASLQEAVRLDGEKALGQLAAMLETSSEKTWEEVVLWGRIWIPLSGIILSFASWGALFLFLFWVALGFSTGTVLWLLIRMAGWRGPFTLWTFVFPQYLCYVPALLLLYIACLRWNEFWRERRGPLRTVVWTPQFRFFLLRLFLGMVLYTLGMWVETQSIPWILKKTL